jgi:hypothetical protein
MVDAELLKNLDGARALRHALERLVGGQARTPHRPSHHLVLAPAGAFISHLVCPPC